MDELDRIINRLSLSVEEMDQVLYGPLAYAPLDDVQIRESKPPESPKKEDYFAVAVAMLEPWRKQ
jgi:hypothetical protein